MGTRVKFAIWHKVGRLFVVRPPDWPKATEYSCTDQETLIQWARNHGYMLKYGGVSSYQKRRNYERFAARDIG